MMNEEIFADFDVETEDKKVLKAHKSVLAVSSPFFFGLLNTKMKEKEDSVVMREVLRFIYSNEVENLSAIVNELVFAAEKYQLEGLKELCVDSIIEALNTENVFQSLMAADRLTKAEELKKKCVGMIVRYV